MGDIFLTDFKFGMDRRRLRVAATPGTLWDAQNVVITRGGDIERAKRFAPVYTMPPGQTFGLAAVRGQLWVFGSTAPNLLSPALSPGLQYQQLVSPSGAQMTQVLDARAANGQLYVIAAFTDGNTYHFYNGARVTDWDAIADGGFTYPILADYLASLINGDPSVSAVAFGNSITITARTAGTAFTIAKSTTNFGSISDQDITLTTLQANVAPVAEVQASSLLTVSAGTLGAITSLTVNGTQLLYGPVPWGGSATLTAQTLATQINNLAATHLYVATWNSNATVTIQAPPGLGATANNYDFVSVSSGDIILLAPSLGGGITAVAGVAQIVQATLIGTPESVDLFDITINGTDYRSTGRASATGTSAFVSTKRIFSTAGALLEWPVLNTFTDWHTGSGTSSGTGFINVSNDAEGTERLVGCGRYISNMAVMSRRNTRIYTLSADATQIALWQPLDNTGSMAARAILQYGDDLFYLDETGIRSLRVRVGSVTSYAYVNDIGVAIDPFVRAQLDGLTSAVFGRAVAVVEPREGRFMLALGPYVYVLSYFPGSNISAWTYLNPGFSISDFARSYNLLYARSGDTVYLYGGAQGTTYPNAGEMVASVALPFVSSNPPGRMLLESYDQAAVGEWLVTACVDPDDETKTIDIGTLDHITYGQEDIALPGRTAFIAFNFTCNAAGYAAISNVNLEDNSREGLHMPVPQQGAAPQAQQQPGIVSTSH